MSLFGSKKHSIGKTITELRKEKGWTQIELAEKLQISDKAISKWEKDSGAPSIEFFPVLAELFGVSIDYLMTGKKPEPEIITMSKIELCAKNDDPKLVDNLSFQSAHIKDETGKTLIDYVYQYKSHKVLTALIDTCNHQTHYMSLFPKKEFDLPELLELIKIDRETIVLKNLTSEHLGLRNVVDLTCNTLWGANNRHKQGLTSEGYRNIINYMVVNYDKLSAAQQTYYFSLDSQSISQNTCWVYAYPYFIDEAYKSNKELFKKLIDKVTENNLIYQKEAENIYKKGRNEHSWIEQQLRYLKARNAYIYVLESTVLTAIDNEDYEIARNLNQFTRNAVEEDTFEQAKIKHDKNLSDDEKIIQSCIHYGILNIDELLATKNLYLIQQALNSYPIHIVEKLNDWFKTKSWKELFRFAVDNNLNFLANSVIKNDTENILKEIAVLVNKNINMQGYPVVNGKSLIVRNNRLTNFSPLDTIINYLSSYKKQVISDATYEFDKEKTVTDLTKEYFETELAKGNTEIVIVKLCVRLEAVLRSTYHYEGDFSEMLNKYCNAYGQEDDGWGYNQEAKFVKYLQKLRKCRNGIVHSEKTQEKLSLDEIRYCIDYICNME